MLFLRRTVALSLLALALSGCTAKSKKYEKPGLPGQVMPAFAGPTLDGARLELNSVYKPGGARASGQVMVLNVWATWCTPCLEELPELEKLHATTKDFAVIGLSVDDKRDEPEVRRIVAEAGVTYPIVLDPDQRAINKLGLFGYPVTFVVDREGTIIWRRDGILKPDDPELRDAIAKALRG